MGLLAIKLVKVQLENHEAQRKARVQAIKEVDAENRIPSLFDAAIKKLTSFIGENPDEDENFLKTIKSLPPDVLTRVALKLDIPYEMFCRARKAGGGDDVSEDVDEWVLRNELWLREISLLLSDWRRGIVRLSTHAGDIFCRSELTATARIITRPSSKSLPGFRMLDGRRAPAIRIQPSVHLYAKTFEAMTYGLLKGLNWDHVFVAGGIALGALLCTKDKEATNTPEQWKNSDVDVYIYGLGPIEANKKIEHIFDVYKKNLPQNAPVLVVRNSKTITFYSAYPLRRIQVVLKLVDSPKDVLLNFDLDICAIGWDGEEVWMLPRAARALETGYTAFTMSLIDGHYLGDRRSTQEERVFKYADKGYGIRILPSYLRAFQAILDDPEKQKEHGIHPQHLTLDFDALVASARYWTARAVTKVGWFQRSNLSPERSQASFIPSISHAWLQDREQITGGIQRRSVLSGFRLFMRHVALWEHQVIGNIVIKKESWASSMYDVTYVFGVDYNEIPRYSWDETFTITGFVESIADFNESQDIVENHHAISLDGHDLRTLWEGGPSLEKRLPQGIRTQRVTHATSVQGIMQPECDIYLPLWLPQTFIDFVDDIVPRAVRESGVAHYTTKVTIRAPKLDSSHGSQLLVFWRTTDITMWQQLDRTIDETHEALWSFIRANTGYPYADDAERFEILVRQFSRRAIRTTRQNEFTAFSLWVSRAPVEISNSYDDMRRLLMEDHEDEPEGLSADADALLLGAERARANW